MNEKYIEMHLLNGRKSPSDSSKVINKEGPVIENIHCFIYDPYQYLLLMCDLVSQNRVKLVTEWDANQLGNTKLRFPLTPNAYGDEGVHEFIGIGCGNRCCFYSDFTLQPSKPEYQLRLGLSKFGLFNIKDNDHTVIENIAKIESKLGCISVYFNSVDAYNKAKQLTNWFDTDLGRGLEVPYVLDSGKILRFNSSVHTENKHQLHLYGSLYCLDDIYGFVTDIFSSIRVDLM